jgi:hypothetical protein
MRLVPPRCYDLVIVKPGSPLFPPPRNGGPVFLLASSQPATASAFLETRRGLVADGTFSSLSVDAGRTPPALGCRQEKWPDPGRAPRLLSTGPGFITSD